ncbi:MAG TPA: hypothetical protein PLM22_12285 [Candidatus Sabulitectum sp.]|nr:hypothetical protein [Candidatus Sabulitectum sp.]HPF33345.1 hypothetical protein [Candidatus Sabulitectum sp.]HPJ29699.1 hypothetical protein [Candidatus Sabulitectum sp.]HPR22878.1 hypothetical protein [Candidatus Sabulitectum sp.]
MRKRTLVILNYGALLLMNAAFYYAFIKDPTHLVDIFGISCLAVTALTFSPLYWRSGIWKLTHEKGDSLDEREVSITREALSDSYGWFAVVCLLIMLAQSVVSRMDVCPKYTITVPLVGSLIYLAHTLPGAFIAWREQV